MCHNNKTHSLLQEFHTQQGEFLHTFEKPLPDVMTSEELEEKNQEISIDKVLKWAEETGNIKMRFAFFETFHANSELYLMVIKPLLSMRAVGSIDVERRVKMMKGNILTKKRNRLKDPKGVAYLRASENLKHIIHAKKVIGKKFSEKL